MKYTKGKISLILLILNIAIGLPLLLSALYGERHYHVRTFVLNDESIERITNNKNALADMDAAVSRALAIGDHYTEESRRNDLSQFIRDQDTEDSGSAEFSGYFKLSIEDGVPTVQSTSSSEWLSNHLNSKVLAELASTHYVETESRSTPLLEWAYVAFYLFGIYKLLIALPTLGYWLYVAFWPSQPRDGGVRGIVNGAGDSSE